MSDDKNNQKTHYWFEDNDNLQEIIKKANVGDYIEMTSNNQMWWQLLEVVDVGGEKRTIILKTMYDLTDEE